MEITVTIRAREPLAKRPTWILKYLECEFHVPQKATKFRAQDQATGELMWFRVRDAVRTGEGVTLECHILHER